MHRNTNKVVSTYRSTQTVESLIRMHNVTGTEFPVSGDAPLRYAFEELAARMTAEEKLARKIFLTATYGKFPRRGPAC